MFSSLQGCLTSPLGLAAVHSEKLSWDTEWTPISFHLTIAAGFFMFVAQSLGQLVSGEKMRKPTDLCFHCKQRGRGMGSCERRDILDNNFCFLLSVFCLCACSSVCHTTSFPLPPPSPSGVPLLLTPDIQSQQSYCLLLRSDTAPGNHVAEEGCYKYSWTIWAGKEESERGSRRRRRRGREKESAGTGQVGGERERKDQQRMRRPCSLPEHEVVLGKAQSSNSVTDEREEEWRNGELREQDAGARLEASSVGGHTAIRLCLLWEMHPLRDPRGGRTRGRGDRGRPALPGELPQPPTGRAGHRHVCGSTGLPGTTLPLGLSERHWQSTHPCPSPAPPALPFTWRLQVSLWHSWLYSHQGSYQ